MCPGLKKNVSNFVQKHFVSTTNVSQFAQPRKHHGQQSVRNNVSSFTRPYLTRIGNYQIHEYGLAEMDTDRGLDFSLSNSLIIHHVKTKKIISVKEVSIDFDDFTSPFTL